MIEITLRHWPFIRWKDESMSVRAVGWISIAVTILTASTFNSFAKKLSGGLSPLTLLFLSEFLTAFFVLLSFGTLPTFKSILRLPRDVYLPLILVGLLSSVVGPFLWFAGLQSTSAVNASLFGTSDVFFLVLLAYLLLGEKLTSAHIWATACIVLGIAIVMLQGFEQGITLRTGDLLILLASLAFSLGSIAFRYYLHAIEPQIVVFVRSSVAVVTFFVISPFLTHTAIEDITTFPLMLIPALLGFAFIARFLNVFSFYAALERLPVSTVSLLGSLTVVVGPLFAYLYIGETLAWYHFVGAGLIILGSVLLELLGIHPSEKHLEQHLEQRAHHRS